jgi:hypothetical protein
MKAMVVLYAARYTSALSLKALWPLNAFASIVVLPGIIALFMAMCIDQTSKR